MGKSDKLSHATNSLDNAAKAEDLEAAKNMYMPSTITMRVIWWHRHHYDGG